MQGFHGCETTGMTFTEAGTGTLLRLLVRYTAGLDSDANYPCGSSRRTVVRWRNQVLRELVTR